MKPILITLLTTLSLICQAQISQKTLIDIKRHEIEGETYEYSVYGFTEKCRNCQKHHEKILFVNKVHQEYYASYPGWVRIELIRKTLICRDTIFIDLDINE